MKTQRGGSCGRPAAGGVRPVGPSGGGVCREGVCRQDQELREEGARGPARVASSPGESAAPLRTDSQPEARPASSGRRSSRAGDGAVATPGWPAGRQRTVVSRSSGGGVAPRQSGRVARSPAGSTASEAGPPRPDPTWGRGRFLGARCLRSFDGGPDTGRPLGPLSSASSLQRLAPRLCRVPFLFLRRSSAPGRPVREDAARDEARR